MSAEVELVRGSGTAFRIRMPLLPTTQADRPAQAVRA